MSMACVGGTGASLLPDARLARFKLVVPEQAWAVLTGILDVSPATESEPVVRQGADMRAEYRAHLEISRDNGHEHAGLAQVVDSLGAVSDDAELHVHHLRTDAGLVILVSDLADRPLGAVALPRRAA